MDSNGSGASTGRRRRRQKTPEPTTTNPAIVDKKNVVVDRELFFGGFLFFNNRLKQLKMLLTEFRGNWNCLCSYKIDYLRSYRLPPKLIYN